MRHRRQSDKKAGKAGENHTHFARAGQGLLPPTELRSKVMPQNCDQRHLYLTHLSTYQ
jgi:hypothetical protein